MKSDLVLVDREALLAELKRVFDVRTAETLLGVLDKVAAQARATGVTREDFSELKQIVAELAQAQQRAEERLSRLELVVERLVETQRDLVDQISKLTDRMDKLTDRMDGLADQVSKLTDKVGKLDGRSLELTYREKADAYFGPLLRRLRVVSLRTLEDTLEAHLSQDEFRDVLLLDLLISGQPRHQPEVSEVWLAVEASVVVDAEDVARAQRRAALLRQAGYRAIPVVAGEQMTLGAEAEARLHQVVVLQDGRSFFWNEALATWAKGRS